MRQQQTYLHILHKIHGILNYKLKAQLKVQLNNLTTVKNQQDT